MPTESPISSLRAGDEVRGVYACVRKDRLMTRTGSPYLALELRDRSGSVQARAFRDADALAGGFERGDLVAVVGRVERFRDDLVVEVSDIRRAQTGTAGDVGAADTVEARPEDFLPVAYRDLDELDGFLEHLVTEVYDPGYRALLDALLADPELRAAFRRTPATRNGHHAYLGGLLEHTVAVASLARELCDLHRRLNSDLLLTAAIVHDIGRTREFTYGAEIGLTDQGRLLGHIVLGQQLLSEHFARQLEALDDARRLALLHCVLTHHGSSNAPGGRFASPEALALYRLNALDAGVKGALEHGLGPQPE
ncbi:MAG: HD domain-containing protein [Conexibacteraceae bacterium]|nr:HD domain-containing protein [Conexibacteraceae bacterium]